jgi:aspartate dehydrogenase
MRVAVAGLGAVGFKVATALDRGIPGLQLVAVSAADEERATARMAGFRHPPEVVPVGRLAATAEIVVECLPPSLFPDVAGPVLARGGTLVAASVGALISHEDLVTEAERAGGRIIVPSGAVVGLDGLRACAEAGLDEVRLVTRKPPTSFGSEVFHDGIVATGSTHEPLLLFSGSARDAIRLFPINVNVAAAVSLAGVGADRTVVEVWADPTVSRNHHRLEVRGAASEFAASVVNLPDPDNPKSSAITGYSIVAALRRLTSPLVVGS